MENEKKVITGNPEAAALGHATWKDSFNWVVKFPNQKLWKMWWSYPLFREGACLVGLPFFVEDITFVIL